MSVSSKTLFIIELTRLSRGAVRISFATHLVDELWLIGEEPEHRWRPHLRRGRQRDRSGILHQSQSILDRKAVDDALRDAQPVRWGQRPRRGDELIYL
jgi:hypothetical protein